MKNILFWVGIVALSLQDYFKKPAKPTRQQQFFQTGGTAQAFIEGNKKVKCKCGWSWKLSDGGNDTYVCHKCGYDNSTEPIEGISEIKKILSYYFGKPKKTKTTWTKFYLKENLAPYYFYRWELKSYFLDLEKYNDYNIFTLRNIDESLERSSFIWEDDIKFEIGDIITHFLYLLESTSLDERYKKIADLAQAGDWELALEIAKGQDLL